MATGKDLSKIESGDIRNLRAYKMINYFVMYLTGIVFLLWIGPTLMLFVSFQFGFVFMVCVAALGILPIVGAVLFL